MSEIHKYLQELHAKADHLKDQITRLENKIHQENLSFEHSKSALQDQAMELTKDYEPKGIGFSYESIQLDSLTPATQEDIQKALQSIYKI